MKCLILVFVLVLAMEFSTGGDFGRRVYVLESGVFEGPKLWQCVGVKAVFSTGRSLDGWSGLKEN